MLAEMLCCLCCSGAPEAVGAGGGAPRAPARNRQGLQVRAGADRVLPESHGQRPARPPGQDQPVQGKAILQHCLEVHA